MMAMSGSARQLPEKTVRSPVKTLGTVRQGGKCVFEDLKLPDAQELNVKAQMAYRICELIQKYKLTQREAASILGTDQPRYVSPSPGPTGRVLIGPVVSLSECAGPGNRDCHPPVQKAEPTCWNPGLGSRLIWV